MSIFSLFGKKEHQHATAGDQAGARKKGRDTTSPVKDALTADSRLDGDVSSRATKRKVAAHATALKIDEIEFEMSSEFMKYPSSGNTLPGSVKTEASTPVATQVMVSKSPTPPTPASVTPDTTAPENIPMGATTRMLLNDDTIAAGSALSESETAPVIEEAAILYANAQTDIAEHILQVATRDDRLGDALTTAWHMLFDLYIMTGKKAQFEHLSIEYANKFETSPPTWINIGARLQQAPSFGTKATPTVVFSGKLDSSVVKQLERINSLAANRGIVRVEFSRVGEVDPVGCGLLLSILKKLQNSGNDLVLVGALDLAKKIRSILQVGRRDETEAPWMLLLEILRLLNNETEFEEVSIDYCVTFEVSPPAFVPPLNKISTATDDVAARDNQEHFLMPQVIEGNVDQLIAEIATYAAQHRPAILDCSELTRVDFSTAGHLLTKLGPLKVKGLEIELHNVNHLVGALFNVIGLKDLVRVQLRKA